MREIQKNILITGPPRVGKTTLLKRLFEELAHHHPAGFYTREIREGGIRKGFQLVSADGAQGLLSHTDIKSRCRVGKYGVDVKGFEDFFDRLHLEHASSGLIIVDEIGKMECFSKKFVALVNRLLDSDKMIIASIASKGGGPIEKIRNRGDVMIYELTLRNRNDILSGILRYFDRVQ